MNTETATRIKWNTGRTYTEHGQRCAAMLHEQGVLMVDVDRGIAYYLPDCELDQFSIMWRYDNNKRCEYARVDWSVREELENYAK